jgi:hypothetical protein
MSRHKWLVIPVTLLLLLGIFTAWVGAAPPVPPSETSPADNLALNPIWTGYPHPLESDSGWGGGSNKWGIVDGIRLEAAWNRGLAFTGGTAPYIAPCGWRQATINFGQPTTFNRVMVWHHALEHVPNTYKIQYLDGGTWVDVFSTVSGHDYLVYPANPPTNWWESFSTPTENTFDPVTSDKVRFALWNCDIVHGWIYEFEAYLTDSEPPTANPVQKPARNDYGWNNTDVTISWNWADEEGGSGIDADNCTMETVATAEGDYQVTASCYDLAGNQGTASYGVKIDKTAPGIVWESDIEDGDEFYFGDVPAAATCTATDGLSGPDQCIVTGYSAAVGVQTLIATASDMAGNTANDTRTYTVLAWTLSGFHPPVNMTAVNVAKGGSTVPLKFNVYAGDTELVDTSIVASITEQPYACDGGALGDPTELITSGHTTLRYDMDAGQFITNWRTPRTPGVCYQITLTTLDGSMLAAHFRLR